MIERLIKLTSESSSKTMRISGMTYESDKGDNKLFARRRIKKGKFTCPVEGCEAEFDRRGWLINHMKDQHGLDYYQANSLKPFMMKVKA